MDVYHKEQLVTKEEAEEVASGWKLAMITSTKDGKKSVSNLQEWVKVAVIKDVVTATRITEILDKHGFNDDAQHIRGKCVCGSLGKGTILS